MEVFSLGSGSVDVGKHLKASKRRFFWQFMVGPDGKPHKLELFASVFSGKRQLAVDGNIVYNVSTMSDFSHSVTIDDTVVEVKSKGDDLSVTIGARPFEALRPRDKYQPEDVIDVHLI